MEIYSINDENLAAELVAQRGEKETLSQFNLEHYFNYTTYGCDLAVSDYSQTSHGYVCSI